MIFKVLKHNLIIEDVIRPEYELLSDKFAYYLTQAQLDRHYSRYQFERRCKKKDG